ncbi:MAG: response regulator transcription factor [Candidatus Obscuribacterales bacterium]
MPEQKVLKIFIAEDQALTRIGLETILSQHADLQVVGTASNGEEAHSKCLALKPDVVIMDLSMPVMNGIDATMLVRAKLPEVKVLIVTSHETDNEIFACFKAGADGYCLKTGLKDDVINAVRTVAEGGAWLDAGIADKVLRSFRNPIMESKTDSPMLKKFELTAREIEVLKFVVEGYGNAAIAKQLSISPQTVKTHMKHLMEKLEVSDRTQAAVKALKHGML